MTTASKVLQRASYEATTNDFDVGVEPTYLPAHSAPDLGRWIWAYHVTIRNRSARAARLVSRRWRIIDASGRSEMVEGPGVVGQTPRIEPGGAFEYHSGCPLGTPSGSMHGHYTMVDDDGAMFEIEVPAFPLELPDAPRTLN